MAYKPYRNFKWNISTYYPGALAERSEKELHHTAAAKGYMSRKVTEELEEYTGKFGKGYKVHRPRYDTSNYHYVDYYVEVL